MNTIEKFIRMTAGVILFILAFVIEHHMLNLLAGIAGILLITTAIFGICPIVALFAMISSPASKKKRRLY